MDILNIMETVWDNSSATFQERVPKPTKENLPEIQSAMVDEDPVVANEFMTTLLNKVVKPHLHVKFFENPLRSLKKGKKPLGDTIEEIYNNFIKGQAFDGNGNTTALMGRNLPDTKTVYHRMNRKDKYPITVSRERLQKAFSSWDNLERYVANIMSVVQSSANLDEFLLIKQLIKIAYEKNALKVVYVKDPLLSKENAEEYIKTVKSISGLMKFPSDQWNSYLTAQSKDKKPIITFSDLDEQVLILDTVTNTSVNVDVLASAFNKSVVEFNETSKLIIDVWDDPDVRGALVDDAFFQIYDDLITIGSFYNGESLYQNYWLHVWQTLAYSILVNGVVFKVKKDEDADGTVEQFTVSYNLAEGITSTNKRTEVAEGGSFTTTIDGAETVTVTMGGEAADVYDAETGKVTIRTITGDIVITAN